MQMACFHQQQLVHYDLKYQTSGQKTSSTLRWIALRSHSESMNFKLEYGGMSHWRISNLPFPHWFT